MFTILAIATMCGGVIFNATTVAMPKVFDERLTALTQTTLGIGVLVSLVYAFAAMAQLIVGYLIDRHSLRSVFVPVVALQAPLLFLAGSVENYAMLLVALAMMFFIFGQIPINDAMVAAYTDEEMGPARVRVHLVGCFGARACREAVNCQRLSSHGGGFQLAVFGAGDKIGGMLLAAVYTAAVPATSPPNSFAIVIFSSASPYRSSFLAPMPEMPRRSSSVRGWVAAIASRVLS